MHKITDEQIIDIFREELKKDYKGEYARRDRETNFSLRDLVGKTVTEYRQIDTKRDNPEYYDILIFNDDSIILTENWGDLECGHLRHYYFNWKVIRFSSGLFGI